MVRLTKITLALIFITLLETQYTLAQGLRFGLVAKSIDDHNFVDTWKGCAEVAAQNGDKCELLGNAGRANPHAQYKAISSILESNQYSALAVSVTHSGIVSNAVRGTRIPIITFDSPFSEEHKNLSRGYVGPNNIKFGEDLAKVAMRFKPNGGTICIMSVLHDVNLAQRVSAIRRVLSGDNEWPPNKKLDNNNGWTESIRCPWNAADNVSRTNQEFKETIAVIKPDIFLSVGHWPLLDIETFKRLAIEYNIQNNTKIIVGIGKVLPEYEELLANKLLNGLVSIDFTATGKMSYEAMRAITAGEVFQMPRYTKNIVLTSD